MFNAKRGRQWKFLRGGGGGGGREGPVRVLIESETGQMLAAGVAKGAA